MFKRKYEYLISYQFNNGIQNGFGEIIMVTGKLSVKIIESIREHIQSNMIFKHRIKDAEVIILNIIKI